MIGVIVVIVVGFIFWRIDLSNSNNRTLHNMKKRNREVIEDIFSRPKKHAASFLYFHNKIEVKKIERKYSRPPIDDFLIHFDSTPSNEVLRNLEKEHIKKVEDIFKHPLKYEQIFLVYGNQIKTSYYDDPYLEQDGWSSLDYSLNPSYTTNPFTNQP